MSRSSADLLVLGRNDPGEPLTSLTLGRRIHTMQAAAISIVVLAGFLACAATAQAQSLGELARKEAERRKSIRTPGKVYTSDDLRAAPAPPVPAAPSVSEPEPAAADGAPDGTLPPEEDPRTPVYWQRRLAAERDALARAETFAEALQSRINALSTDFINRDDPAQRAIVGADRDKALAELDRVRREIGQHQKAIAAIQEEGRRAGVPAGWLR